jgi:hypothetical protein
MFSTIQSPGKAFLSFTLWTSSRPPWFPRPLKTHTFPKGHYTLDLKLHSQFPRPSSPPSVSSIVRPNIKGSPHTESIGKALLSVMPMTQNLFSNGGDCLDPRICSTLETWNPLTFVKKKPLHIKPQVRMRERANCIAGCLCTNFEGWKKWGPTFVPSIGVWNNLGWKITR